MQDQHNLVPPLHSEFRYMRHPVKVALFAAMAPDVQGRLLLLLTTATVVSALRIRLGLEVCVNFKCKDSRDSICSLLIL